MRISDWSSDVCSSDLLVGHELVLQRRAARGDLLELRRIAKAARRPAEQGEMQRMTGIVDRNRALADLFLRERHRSAVAQRGAFDLVDGERDLGRATAPGQAQAYASCNAQRSEERRVGKGCVSTC